MQRQFAEQLFELALVADQTQMGRAEDRLQQRVRGKLGDAVRETDGQARHLATGRLPNLVGDHLAKLEDLLGSREGGLAGLGEGHAAAGRLEQLVAQRLLQFPHLRTDGLHGHVQPLGSPGEAAFLGDDPEVVQVAQK